MADSARQPDVEILVIVLSPSISPEENLRMQRNSTRRAFLICRFFSMLIGVVYRPWKLLAISDDDSLVHGYGAQGKEAA